MLAEHTIEVRFLMGAHSRSKPTLAVGSPTLKGVGADKDVPPRRDNRGSTPLESTNKTEGPASVVLRPLVRALFFLVFRSRKPVVLVDGDLVDGDQDHPLSFVRECHDPPSEVFRGFLDVGFAHLPDGKSLRDMAHFPRHCPQVHLTTQLAFLHDSPLFFVGALRRL